MAKSTKNNTGLTTKADNAALIAPKTSKDVPGVIANLELQLKELKKNAPDDISLDINYNGKNIKNVTSVGELLQISASIHARNNAYSEELKRYNLETANIAPFKESDKDASQWAAIINKAIFELINKVQIEKLENAIAKLANHLDAETKLERELSSIVNMASGAII